MPGEVVAGGCGGSRRIVCLGGDGLRLAATALDALLLGQALAQLLLAGVIEPALLAF